MSSSPSDILLVAALKPEIKPLRKALVGMPNVRLKLTGIGPSRAYDAVRSSLDNVRLVVSTGCCGGLVPGAAAGLMVVPSRLLEGRPDGSFCSAPSPDVIWSDETRRVASRLGMHCTDRPLITVSVPLKSPEIKEETHKRSGAVAVDMESAAVARAAAEAGVPHLVTRIVLDSVDEHLPEREVSDDHGNIRPLRLVRAMTRPRSFVTHAALALRLRTISGSLAGLVRHVLSEESE